MPFQLAHIKDASLLLLEKVAPSVVPAIAESMKGKKSKVDINLNVDGNVVIAMAGMVLATTTVAVMGKVLSQVLKEDNSKKKHFKRDSSDYDYDTTATEDESFDFNDDAVDSAESVTM